MTVREGGGGVVQGRIPGESHQREKHVCVCASFFSFRDFFLLPSLLPESEDATLSFPLFRVTSSLLFFTAVSGSGTL